MLEGVFFSFSCNMMLPKIGSANDDGDGNSSNGQLLRDIEAISKALYLHKAPQRTLISSSIVPSKSVEKPHLSEPKSNLNPIIPNESVLYKGKQLSSVWNWKRPLKALTHIRHQKFNIFFSLHVHSIEGLPPSFNDISLSVHWKKKDDDLQTSPSRVLKGIAEFEETLVHKCSVYGSRSGPHNSAKYGVKLFLIYASIIGAPGVDMGKQWVDLTRLLPLTLEELEGEKSTGKWTTSFRLAGRAKGATLYVSFGFSVLRDNFTDMRSNMNVSEVVNFEHGRSSMWEPIIGFGMTNNGGMLRRVGSVPSNLNRGSPLPRQLADAKICDEVSPNMGLELSKSIRFLYQKLNEVNLHSSEELDTLSELVQPIKPLPVLEFEADKGVCGNKYDNTEFTVIEQGVEISMKEQSKLEHGAVQIIDGSAIETINVNEIFKEDDNTFDEETKIHSEDILHGHVGKVLGYDCKHEENSLCKKGLNMEDLESAFFSLLVSEPTKLETQLAMGDLVEQENYVETKSDYKARKLTKKSCSLDETAEYVASDFLNMLGIEHSPFHSSLDNDPESPRERLLREFEKEALASGNFIIDYEANAEQKDFGGTAPSGSGCRDFPEDIDLSLVIQAAEEEHQWASQLPSSRKNAKKLEDLETEVLMREWGLNEGAFQYSPRHCSDGFGSPIELPPQEPVQLPPLGDGFGPFIETKGRSYLRSMDPSLIRNSKNVGSLIMQLSCPVVLPAEIGSDIMEILQHLASVGIEKLSLWANKLMPLEDITGKTLQQIATSGAAVPHRQSSLHHESLSEQEAFSGRRAFWSGWSFKNFESRLDGTRMGSDYATLEDLVPLAMDKIESMSIEGLRIQSGMSEEKAPSSIISQSIGNIPAFECKIANLGGLLGLDGAALLQPVDSRDSFSDIDGLMDLSITFEEWLRLDAGIIGNKDQVSERTMMILAAHHANCIDVVNGGLTRDINWDKISSGNHTLLGNKITVALMMLLRDPLRNYEPVGTSMLALIHVERALIHTKPRVCAKMLERRSNEEDDLEWLQEEEMSDKREKEGFLWFKINEVHLSGVNTTASKMQLWGTRTQQQSGARWLLASGMSKSYMHPDSMSKAIVVSNPQWRPKQQIGGIFWSLSSHANVTEVPHRRNPNVIFPE